MRKFNAAAAAQGACAANGIAMPNSKGNFGLHHSQNLPKSILRLCFLFLLGITISTMATKAQGLDTLLANDLGLYVTSESGFIESGETAILHIELGNNESVVNNAIAFSIDLKIDQDAIMSINPAVSIASSWFFDPTNANLGVAVDLSTRTITLSGFTTNAVSGFGNVLDISIEAGPDGIYANQIVNSTGGIVIIENIGFKRPQEFLETESSVYPNPFNSTLNFDWGTTTPSSVQVFNQQGILIAKLSQDQISMGKWYAPEIPSGLYHVVIESKDSRSTFKVLKN